MQRIALAVLAVLLLALPVAAQDMAVDQPTHNHASSMDADAPMEEHVMDAATDHGDMTHGDMNHDAMSSEEMATGEMQGHDHEKMMEEAAQAAEEDGREVGIEEKLGGYVADAVFTDSEGNRVNLKEMVTVPTILLPVYFKCPDVCNLLQSSFAQILPDVALTPGTEIQVISLSFDARDTPEVAARAKKQYLAAMRGAFPAEHWHFLTGDQQAIDRALDSIGYTVRRQGGLFAHPVAVIALSPGGKIVRYLYGSAFLPMDITIAATKAAEGITSLSVKRLLSMCYNYDPEGRRYVFSTLRVAGFSILLFVLGFVAFLVLGGKKRRSRKK